MSDPADLYTIYWDSLAHAVEEAVDSGRIGDPKALRLTVHIQIRIQTDARDVRAQAEMAASRSASAWFKGEAIIDYGVDNSDLAAARLMVWPGGQSALMAVSAGSGDTEGNLVLMGSRGAIYHRITHTAVTKY